MEINLTDHTRLIKAKAQSLGFVACGVSRAAHLKIYDEYLSAWVSEHRHAGMKYFEKNSEKRTDPRKLVDGALSVVSLLYPYFPKQLMPDSAPKIAKYAYGQDYHSVLKDKMALLFAYMKSFDDRLDGRLFTDSAPVLDKVWAQKAGLGWIGKNSLLINRELGSYFFIGELIVNAVFEYDESEENDYCGNCNTCVISCPTSAIMPNRSVDSNRCVSYLNKDHQSEVSPELSEKFSGWVFGCDICQDVCPWNKKPIVAFDSRFEPHHDLLSGSVDWRAMEKPYFNELFKKSAVKRMGFDKFRGNVDLWLKLKA